MSAAWVVAATLLLGSPGQGACGSCPSLFHLPGDLMIEGLFPVHDNGTWPSGHSEGPLPVCSGINPWGYSQFQAMRLAVEEINKASHLLPNVTLGYHIWDTCEDRLYLQAVLQLGPGGNSRAGYARRVVAVVGPDTTRMTHLLSRILTFYQFLQISYNAKDRIFTDKEQFPLLFRMVPNENHQIRGLLSLIKELGWKWVSAVGRGTRASEQTVQMLITEAEAQGICVSYQGLLASAEGNLVSRGQLKKTIENIERARTNVTLLLAKESMAQRFFQVVIELRITGKIWIAPESWVLSDRVISLPGMEAVGTVIGLTIKPVILPQFLPFVKKTLHCEPWNSSGDPLPPELRNLPRAGSCDQYCTDCHSLSPEILEDVLNTRIWHWSFYSYAAIYALAQALHQLLGCDRRGCLPKEGIKAGQLYEILAQVDFTLQNNTIKFSDQTDLFLGYNVITWRWDNGTPRHETIGSYSVRSLTVDQSKIKWPTADGRVPPSTCVTLCQAGQMRIRHTMDECTCRCDDCPEGTYQNQTNSDLCLPCPPRMWSPARSARCFHPATTFLSLRDTTVGALVALTAADFALLCACLLVFALHLRTPVVRAAGGKLALVMLASLLASCAVTLLFVAEPSPLGCFVRQPLFALGFTVCISCLLVRSCQIVFIFKLARRLPWVHQLWLKYRGMYTSLGLCLLVQGALCTLWLHFSPPFLKVDTISSREVFLRCSEGHFLGLGSVLGFLALLGGACFGVAFWGRNLPKNYNEARLLALSMLVFLMAWGSFILIYATTEGKGRQIAALQMFTVQTSIYAILCTFFLPKCYIILFRPQHNTVAHFQTCIQAYTASPRDAAP